MAKQQSQDELMGWMGEHLDQFRKGDSYYAPAYQREEEMPSLYGRIENYNQEDFTLGDILCEKGDTMVWEYDFGGIWGYEDLLELHARRAAHKRISAEVRERLEWYGMDRDFNPEWLCLEECREIVEAFNS